MSSPNAYFVMKAKCASTFTQWKQIEEAVLNTEGATLVDYNWTNNQATANYTMVVAVQNIETKEKVDTLFSEVKQELTWF
jgi:hypothetical protein